MVCGVSLSVCLSVCLSCIYIHACPSLCVYVPSPSVTTIAITSLIRSIPPPPPPSALEAKRVHDSSAMYLRRFMAAAPTWCWCLCWC